MPTPLITQPRKGWLKTSVLACTGAFGLMLSAAHAQQINTVFYILLENRCLSSGTDKSYNNVIYGNPAAPYLNALMTPGNPLAVNSSWCSAYHHVNSQTTGDFIPQTGNKTDGTGAGGSIHPSEPNYVFMEAGSNLSKYDDNDPYGSTNSVAQIAKFLSLNPNVSGENFCALLQNAGITWKAYQEGTNLLNSTGGNINTAGGTLTNNVAPVGQRTVPLASFSGTSASYTNPINGSHQYNFAAKHCGSLFFTATNGSTVTTANTSTSNVAVSHYGPLEDLDTDLANNTVAAYNVITPDQYNDGHTALSTAFVYTPTAANFNMGTGQSYAGGSDLNRIALMDNGSAVLVNKIVNSSWYSAASPNGGTNGSHTAIVLWTDETEGSPQDDYYHTLLEIVISPLCKGNAYNSTLNFTHSSDLATFQKVFAVTANTPTGYLNDAANASQMTVGTATTNTGQGLVPATGQPFQGFGTGTATDLSDLFQPGTIPAGIPGLNLTASGFAYNRKTNVYSQTVTVTNALSTAITNPVYLVVGSLTNTTLNNKTGTTVNNFPGNPYISVSPSGLAAGASATVTLQFAAPSSGGISDTMSAINTAAQP